MKERTMDALSVLENYFCAVIEQEAHGDVVPSRTEELCCAAKGLKSIAVTKYKQWLKHKVTDSETMTTTMPMTTTSSMSYKH